MVRRHLGQKPADGLVHASEEDDDAVRLERWWGLWQADEIRKFAGQKSKTTRCTLRQVRPVTFFHFHHVHVLMTRCNSQFGVMPVGPARTRRNTTRLRHGNISILAFKGAVQLHEALYPTACTHRHLLVDGQWGADVFEVHAIMPCPCRASGRRPRELARRWPPTRWWLPLVYETIRQSKVQQYCQNLRDKYWC